MTYVSKNFWSATLLCFTLNLFYAVAQSGELKLEYYHSTNKIITVSTRFSGGNTQIDVKNIKDFLISTLKNEHEIQPEGIILYNPNPNDEKVMTDDDEYIRIEKNETLTLHARTNNVKVTYKKPDNHTSSGLEITLTTPYEVQDLLTSRDYSLIPQNRAELSFNDTSFFSELYPNPNACNNIFDRLKTSHLLLDFITKPEIPFIVNKLKACTLRLKLENNNVNNYYTTEQDVAIERDNGNNYITVKYPAERLLTTTIAAIKDDFKGKIIRIPGNNIPGNLEGMKITYEGAQFTLPQQTLQQALRSRKDGTLNKFEQDDNPIIEVIIPE